MSGRTNKVGAEMQDSNAPNKSFFSEKASALAGQSMRIVTRIGRNARKHA
jgi:hypothetical protein